MAGRQLTLFLSAVAVALLAASSAASETHGMIGVEWDKGLRTSKTAVSIAMCVEPPLRRGSPIHDQLFEAVRDLRGDYVRFVPWHPYPKLAVVELEPPHDGKTFWDFSAMDSILIDFMQATAGHPVVMNISTIPQWMFKTDKPVLYPSDPDKITWNYEQGTELRDATMKEVADYWARVASWYTQGGFKDEYGQWHQSGHHYKFAYWEVLNEVDYEHKMSPEFYTSLYDAIVPAVRQAAPGMRFMGMSLTYRGAMKPEYFEYFLNTKNHQSGIPLDAISYHFYAFPAPDESMEVMQHTFFTQADGFINCVRFIESIRKRLSPQTATHVNEVETILPDSLAVPLIKPIPDSYWNLSGAMFAYIYAKLVLMGIDVVHESELISYPGQYAGTTLVDWNTGRPNARYGVLKLLRENFGPGDKLVMTQVRLPAPPEAGDDPSERDYVYAQGFVTGEQKRKILLINKRDQDFEMTIPGADRAQVEYVDQTTNSKATRKTSLPDNHITLHGFAVAVVTFAE